MSGGEVRRVSRQDIQLVQDLIERCLQLYMNQQEAVETLLVQAKIEPGFTELIWQKLEDENRDFFKAYHLRLMVKQQIILFNKLLEQQVELMHQMRAGVTSISGSNGSNIQQLQQSSTCFAQGHNGTTLKPEYMQAPIGSHIPTVITNGGSGLQTIMHTVVDMSGHGPSRRIDVPSNMLRAQNSDIGNLQGMNGGMIKSEPSYSGNIPFMFSDDGNTLETRTIIGDGSFNGVEANSQNLSESQPLLDADTSTYGFLNRIPRNFSLSDLTADFNHSSDILEYSRSPFLVTDADAFLDSRERGENQGDDRKLGTISEYENFGSG